VASLLLVASHSQKDRWVAWLEARGHAVVLAPHADRAVDRVREGGIDLVILDYEVDGDVGRFVDVMHRLPEPAPFVLISSASDAPAVSARLGAAAFLPKPFPFDELARVLSRVIPPLPAPTDERTHRQV
jgi:CheY-like chemotaxis protein